MPISIGYHPYFNLHDAPRDQWTVHIGARKHLLLSDKLLATGESKPMELPDQFTLQGKVIDYGFYDLARDSDGKAQLLGTAVRLENNAVFGPKFPVNVTYAPPGKDFICFEHMAAMTNALNSDHALQTAGWRALSGARVSGCR